MTRTAHLVDGAPQPRGPYSHAVSSGGLIATAGASGIRPGEEWEPVSDDVVEQARQTMTNLGVILGDAGASFADVIRTGIYLTDPAHYGPVNEVYREFMPEPFPARTTVYVGLPAKILVEIDMLAVLPTGGPA